MERKIQKIELGPIYIHTKTGKEYIFIMESMIKDTDRIWKKVVIYKVNYKNKDGQIWVRFASDFYSRFHLKEDQYGQN